MGDEPPVPDGNLPNLALCGSERLRQRVDGQTPYVDVHRGGFGSNCCSVDADVTGTERPETYVSCQTNITHRQNPISTTPSTNWMTGQTLVLMKSFIDFPCLDVGEK